MDGLGLDPEAVKEILKGVMPLLGLDGDAVERLADFDDIPCFKINVKDAICFYLWLRSKLNIPKDKPTAAFVEVRVVLPFEDWNSLLQDAKPFLPPYRAAKSGKATLCSVKGGKS